MNESKRRSILKAVSWRIFASIDTFLIVWLIRGSVSTSSWIAGIESFTKVFYIISMKDCGIKFHGQKN